MYRLGATNRVAEREFGVPTKVNKNPVTASIAVTATQILRNNSDRLAFIIINLGANDVYINIEAAVSTTNGIKLGASGGATGFSVKDDGELLSEEFWAIGDGGVSIVLILETEAA